MPVEVSAFTDEIIGLSEFRRRVVAKVDPQDEATLRNISLDLVALANNEEILLSQMAKDIGLWREPDFAMYSAQSCILDRFGPFTVRANIWPSVAVTRGEKSALSYNAYHDHNFSFATTNIYGPGYVTDLFEVPASERQLNVADTVDIRSVGEWQLRKGRVVIYSKGSDVHAQLPPLEPSASLNLIVSGEDVLYGDQFYFDPKRKMIIGMVENVVAKRMSLLELGRYLAGPRSVACLREISESCKCVRSAAIAAELLQGVGRG
ncbi:hypothetical protein L2Y96_15225 [Luteibacter aegosomaticola]|uniref:hypothetical protein n=1 Tax=Luteibacter aegosomaticola TaxID=2911538 RepID=UPI001FFAD56D|nr:hypothetical protein [Luteibacter aegosomaticola]UPG88751.1 hypothetical protein L2Y96_15225 [Luteibacter aegosomaticola]